MRRPVLLKTSLDGENGKMKENKKTEEGRKEGRKAGRQEGRKGGRKEGRKGLNYKHKYQNPK